MSNQIETTEPVITKTQFTRPSWAQRHAGTVMLLALGGMFLVVIVVEALRR
ncbi:MAG: hypothetical protein KDA27_25715 [Candidatus Eisenbacteria bacterium]|uniref:Uncharacterized protein n=1 Tax=Eiseniibacteriota bacterium TaxID=2212470 RepID=A0A956SI67_UNCEI|nr:hypothetical protein [Candidatus Eisenbacteria bacterium]MCB9466430.1 hypothetical protein [Candidatus Eisenbacteria bacterium]